jgi:hypothetical protein
VPAASPSEPCAAAGSTNTWWIQQHWWLWQSFRQLLEACLALSTLLSLHLPLNEESLLGENRLAVLHQVRNYWLLLLLLLSLLLAIHWLSRPICSSVWHAVQCFSGHMMQQLL